MVSVPLEGDPSSLQSWKLSWRMGVLRVSVPTRGTHLLYLWKFQHVILVGGSVPTKEPHLLYYLNRLLRQWRWVLSFRPLEGDPSSLLNSYAERSSSDFISAPTKGIHLLYFVSKGSRTKSLWVSVPSTGTHLLYAINNADASLDDMGFPSPRRGPIFSTPSELYTNFRITTAHFSW